MTLILGVEDPVNERAFLFCDSGIWRNGDASATLSPRKIWRSNGWIAGAAGAWDLCQAIPRIEIPHCRSDADETEVTTALLGWIDAVYDRCGDIAARVRKVDGDAKYGTPSIVVARGSMVFEVEETGVCRTTLGYACAGAWTYALGAMSALDVANLPAFERGKEAARAVNRITDAVRPPFHFLGTDATSGTFGAEED